MPDGMVVNVRQVLQYPPTNHAVASDGMLIQRGGLGGPYQSIAASALVATALNSGASSLAVGYPVPADSDGSQIFTGNFVAPNTGGLLFNAYWDDTGTLRYWQQGPAGVIVFENGVFDIQTAAAGAAGQALSSFAHTVSLDQNGNLTGTNSVARGTVPPTDGTTLWWDEASACLYYNNGAQWVVAVNGPWAGLESPHFKGHPRAPTPPAGDSSTRIATTEFVQTSLWTTVTNGFTSPAVGDFITVTVQSTRWMTVGAPLVIASDTYRVSRVNSLTSVTLQLLYEGTDLPQPPPPMQWDQGRMWDTGDNWG